VQTPKLLSSTQYKMEGKQQFGVRKVWLEETQNLIQHETYQALVYYS
jgi:phage repressor protein C with HTH and peptisase S24 domain